MIQGLLNEFNLHGDRGMAVPLSRIDDLKQDVMNLKNEEPYTGWLDWRIKSIDAFIPEGLCFKPQSLISVISPSTKIILQFNYNGKAYHCTVPPTYADYRSHDERILKYVNEYLKPLGFMAAIAYRLPQKLLAVHCGLGLYGRNNICYNEEFGSYIKVSSYVSDLPSDETKWLPIHFMDQCKNCNSCESSCPTNAIDTTRQIIDADNA